MTEPTEKPTKRRRGHNEGSIHQRASDGLWVAEVSLGYGPDGRPRRKRMYGKTRVDANRKLQQVLHEVRQGASVQTREQSLGQYLERWLEDGVKPTVRPKTYKSYESVCRINLIPLLGRHKLVTLNAQHIAAYMTDRLAAGLSIATVNYHRAVLRAALNQAMRWDMVNRNVAELVQPRAGERFAGKPLTAEEAERLLAAARGDRIEALYSVAVTLGLRQGEALGLRWSDVDLEQGTLSVRHQLQRVEGKPTLVEPKTKRSRRTLPVPEQVLRSLREHRRRQLEDRLAAGPRWNEGWGLVFCTGIGTPLDVGNLGRHYKALLKAAGLEDRRYHDLRHSCGSFLVARDVHPRVIMEILGHSQIATSMNIYAHVDLSEMREATNRLDDLSGAKRISP